MFTAGEHTVDFQLLTVGAYVITDVDYVVDMGVEVWLDEQSRATSITVENQQGKLAFTINNDIQDGSRLRWTAYDTVIEQRQSLSKALRKFKPEADV